MKKNKQMKRRQFLKKLPGLSAGIIGFPTIVSAAALGRNGKTAPSNRIVMGGIGFGMMGVPNMRAFLNKDNVQFAAVCDLDEKRLKRAKGIVDQKYGSRDCTAYHDFTLISNYSFRIIANVSPISCSV